MKEKLKKRLENLMKLQQKHVGNYKKWSLLEEKIQETLAYLNDDKHFCGQCNETHPEKNECPQCLGCLYRYAKQIPDDMYPIFECTQCGKRVFWD